MTAEFPFAAEDAALVAAAKGITVLSHVAWPRRVGQQFLTAWREGRPELPVPPPVRLEAPGTETLERLSTPAGDHPVARFIARTAASYLQAVRLLEAAGTPEFLTRSLEIYGGPSDRVLPNGLTSLQAAEHFIQDTDSLAESCHLAPETYCVPAEVVARRMQEEIDRVFTDRPLPVEIDPTLTAKAMASAKRVRLRSGACFHEADVRQLVEHEALVHAATSRNGRAQPHLTSLQLAAPRTTATQEGLATFAELITNAIDLTRLRRIALRIVAVERALSGADFLDVFRFYLDAGYPEEEGYASTVRVFRGGDVRGRVVFTKDVVYLRGLLQTHAWFHAGLAARKVAHPHYLFAGRLTWHDVEELAPFFAQGWIAPPRIEPTWVKNRDNLAAYLSFSNLTHMLPVTQTKLADFATRRYRVQPRSNPAAE